jgi:hypothetical protein
MANTMRHPMGHRYRICGHLRRRLRTSAGIFGQLSGLQAKPRGKDLDAMANENLRLACARAGLQPDELADIVGVDVKTVRRWLGGQIPYPRHRDTVARALDTSQLALWPEAAVSTPTPAVPSDLIAAYPTGDDSAAPVWQTLLQSATERIDLLDETLAHVLDVPDVIDALVAKAAEGCVVRVMAAATGTDRVDPYDGIGRQFAPGRTEDDVELLDDEAEVRWREWEAALEHAHQLLSAIDKHPGIEARTYGAMSYNTILRFDDEMLVSPRLWARPISQSPLLHLRRRSDEGLFDQFAEHFDAVWDEAGMPINIKLSDLEPVTLIDPEDEEDDAGESPRGEHRASPADQRSSARTKDQRRWPGRDG